jgi:hypothetical protein
MTTFGIWQHEEGLRSMSLAALPYGLVLPTGFPDGLFEDVKHRIVPSFRNPSPELDNVLGAQNAVRFRLRACVEYSEEFVNCVRQVGGGPSMESRYRQERQLFGFFVSGIAALESFNFFIHFAAAQLKPSAFPIQKPEDIRAITRRATAEGFTTEFPGDALTVALNNLAKDPKLKEWLRVRNALAHRTAPGRVVYGSMNPNSRAPAPDWKIDPAGPIKIDENLTPLRLQWLVATLADLVSAADPFTRKYFGGSMS